MARQRIQIIGGGSCGLFLSCLIDTSKYEVTVYDRNSAAARKFLVAGAGGLNLTHGEAAEIFVTRYTPGGFLDRHFKMFDNAAFIGWLKERGIPTFKGSSGRIFPDGNIKPVQVLNKLLQYAEERGVKFMYQCEWEGFSQNNLVFKKDQETLLVAAGLVVFCLGGASWPVTGSKGDWLKHFENMGVPTLPFEASNCGFVTDWPEKIKEELQGQPLKNVMVSCQGINKKGELVITNSGLEGSGIYPFSPYIRQQLKEQGIATIYIDMKPDVPQEVLVQKLSAVRMPGSYSDHIRKAAGLDRPQFSLVKSVLSKEDFADIRCVAAAIKKTRVHITGCTSLGDAISTVGGISLDAVDDDFQLKNMKQVYVIGEMLDYDAPTGGYLLQSCFTMAASLAAHLNVSEIRK